MSTICQSSAFLLIKRRLSIGLTGLSSSLPWLKWASVPILSGGSRSFTQSFAVPFLSMVSPLALSNLPVGCVRAVPCPPYCMSSPWKCSLIYVRCYPDNRELKQLRRRPQRRRQRTIGLMIKKQLCTCITLFSTFLWSHCTTTTWNLLIWRFMEDVDIQRRIFLYLCWTWIKSLRINSRKSRLHLI